MYTEPALTVPRVFFYPDVALNELIVCAPAVATARHRAQPLQRNRAMLRDTREWRSHLFRYTCSFYCKFNNNKSAASTVDCVSELWLLFMLGVYHNGG